MSCPAELPASTGPRFGKGASFSVERRRWSCGARGALVCRGVKRREEDYLGTVLLLIHKVLACWVEKNLLCASLFAAI